jgi:hypothetical protein
MSRTREEFGIRAWLWLGALALTGAAALIF